MLEFGSCPRCKLDISEERRKAHLVICNHCGYTASGSENVVHQYIERKTTAIFGGLLVFVASSFVLMANWDKHALEIVPLTIKESLGGLNATEVERKAEMCMDLKKWDCVETAYSQIAATDNQQAPRLGLFQMRRLAFNRAAQTYYGYFQKGGQDLESSYNYAKALAELGEVDKAIGYFDQVLQAKPDVIQVTVVQNYVKLLMKHQRFEQAKALIVSIREKSTAANSFMESEYREIETQMTASRS